MEFWNVKYLILTLGKAASGPVFGQWVFSFRPAASAYSHCLPTWIVYKPTSVQPIFTSTCFPTRQSYLRQAKRYDCTTYYYYCTMYYSCESQVLYDYYYLTYSVLYYYYHLLDLQYEMLG